MSFALALALVPAPLVTADWSIETATMAQAAPVAIAMQADPAPSPFDVASPTPVDIGAPPPIVSLSPPPATAIPIKVVGKKHHARGDPLEGFNRESYKFSTRIDKALLRPVAMAYRHVVPVPARDGIRNALSNIGEPIVFVNDVLQLKIGRAFRTLGRFVINSTLGLAGLFDNAKRKPFFLRHHNNSFGDTLGYYGVGPGPYLYLPILGPTTLRDAVAGQLQGMLLPNISRTPFGLREYQISTGVVGGLDQRAESDDDLRVIIEDSVDPYATLRSVVLQDRAGEIEGLKSGDMDDATRNSLAIPADPSLDTPLDDPAASPTPVAPQPGSAPASPPAQPPKSN